MPLFLDSNIFLGYAIYFDDWHDKCRQLFGGDYLRYTGRRVKEEVNEVVHRRIRKLYNELARHLAEGKRPDQFFPSARLSEEDYNHFEKWKKSFTTRDPKQILTRLRQLILDIKIRLDDAFQKVCEPLVDYSDEEGLMNKLVDCIGNPNDAWILVDAFCWCEKRMRITFCTTDSEHIVSNRDHICAIIREHRGIRKEALPLRILHLEDVLC